MRRNSFFRKKKTEYDEKKRMTPTDFLSFPGGKGILRGG